MARKHHRICGSVLGCMVLLICLFQIPLSAWGAFVEGIIAVVNGEIITLSEVIVREKKLLSAGRAQDLTDDARRRIREQILHDLIDERLMIGEAERTKLAPSDDDIRKHIDQIRVENGLQSDEDLDAALARDGLTRADLKKRIYEEISLFRVHQRALYQNIPVSDNEIQEYYEREWTGKREETRIDLSQILLPCAKPEQEEEVLKLAHDIMGQWRQGRPFTELASRYSGDASSKDGGQLGWFSFKDLRAEFADAIRNIEPGSIAGPMKTDLGYHILYVNARKDQGLEKGSPTWEKIRETLIERNRANAFEQWLERLRKKAFIEIKDDSLARFH